MAVANGMYLVNEYNIVIPLQCYVVYITTIAGEYCTQESLKKEIKVPHQVQKKLKEVIVGKRAVIIIDTRHIYIYIQFGHGGCIHLYIYIVNTSFICVGNVQIDIKNCIYHYYYLKTYT